MRNTGRAGIVLRSVAVVAVVLVAGCGGADDAPPDPERVAEARQAATIWLSATWRHDDAGACPNVGIQPRSTPPFGGCGQGGSSLSKAFNPQAEPLTSVVIDKISVDGDRAEFDTDHVTVNGRPLSESVDRAAGDGHTRYVLRFTRVSNLWYFATFKSDGWV